jgi:hypothetical protein
VLRVGLQVLAQELLALLVLAGFDQLYGLLEQVWRHISSY